MLCGEEATVTLVFVSLSALCPLCVVLLQRVAARGGQTFRHFPPIVRIGRTHGLYIRHDEDAGRVHLKLDLGEVPRGFDRSCVDRPVVYNGDERVSPLVDIGPIR